MSEKVKVPFNGKASENAVLLLAAAEQLDLDPSVVETTSGAYLVPQEVKDKAFEEKKSEDTKAPAKKAAAKKAAPKKDQE